MREYELTGANLVGGEFHSEPKNAFRAEDRASGIEGASLEPPFFEATPADVEAAFEAAQTSFEPYRQAPPEARAALLESIAGRLESRAEAWIDRAHAETALPEPRLKGECARTCNQLRMFAEVVREGSWVDARIETADPSRAASPKPDLRRMLVPLGPVAVFGASNFPFAFSVAGGDVASALAAGCPVVAKAHPGHPGASEIAARAIAESLGEQGLPPGTFSMLHGGAEVGRMIVLDPRLRALAFTGSLRVGRALYDLAALRPRPIPVYAEMGSVNPVFVLPGALEADAAGLAQGYAASLTLGAGQFCTNPGIVVGLASHELEDLARAVADQVSKIACHAMLTRSIAQAYREDVSAWSDQPCFERLDPASHASGPAFFRIRASDFLAIPEASHEVFGPAGLLVVCDDIDEMKAVADSLEGQLTATLWHGPGELPLLREIVPHLEKIAGRVLFNGFPTGVEVNAAMQHGGPYPATTDSRSTSVGTAAIERFVRPVAYQNMPHECLPAELRDENPRGIARIVDGRRSNQALPG